MQSIGQHGARGDRRRFSAIVSACAVCLALLGCNRGESMRRPVPGERIVAERASGNPWVAGKTNDMLIRYRFTEAKDGSTFFDANLLPPDSLPLVRVEYFRGEGMIWAEGDLAWRKRFC